MTKEIIHTAEHSWDALVREAFRDLCGNCGGSDRLRPRMIVPEEAGGKLVPGNGILLCRACDLTMDLTTRYPEASNEKRPVNFWVSRDLYNRLSFGSDLTSFKSMAGLLRFLMTKYVSDPSRFDDLASYQDSGMDVKVNIWMEAEVYAEFKRLVDENGLTVTSALKGLIGMFEAEARVLFEDSK